MLAATCAASDVQQDSPNRTPKLCCIIVRRTALPQVARTPPQVAAQNRATPWHFTHVRPYKPATQRHTGAISRTRCCAVHRGVPLLACSCSPTRLPHQHAHNPSLPRDGRTPPRPLRNAKRESSADTPAGKRGGSVTLMWPRLHSCQAVLQRRAHPACGSVCPHTPANARAARVPGRGARGPGSQ